jgi:hypothetical protein
MSSSVHQRTDCFSVFSLADPSTLPRVLEVFSLHGLVPASCHSTRDDADQLVIDVQVTGLSQVQAEQLARRLGRTITVTQVLWSEKRVAAPQAAA